MPNWKTHIAFGLIFVAIFYFIKYLKLVDLKILVYIPVIIFFSQLPDIDSKTSKIRMFVNIMGFSMIIVMLILYFILQNNMFLITSVLILITLILSYFLKHRGWLHSILGAFILCFVLIFINITLFVVCFLAYISHLIIDKEIKII